MAPIDVRAIPPLAERQNRMATRKQVEQVEVPKFVILGATETISTLSRKDRSPSKATAEGNAMLTEIARQMSKLPAGRQAKVPVSSFGSVRGSKDGTTEAKAKAAKAFVTRWLKDNEGAFSNVLYSSDWENIVLVK